MDCHLNELKKACRVCGMRLSKARGRSRSYLVADHQVELAEVFMINTSNDEEATHTLSFCHSCRVFMRSWLTRGGSTPAVGRVFAWMKHTEPLCTVRSAHILPISTDTTHHNISGLSPLQVPPIRRKTSIG